MGNKESKLRKGKLAQYYQIKEKLGSGNFAVVRRVIKKSDGKEFAAKIISKRNLKQEELDTLNDEVNIMYKMNHKNVVRLYEMYDTPRHLYLVMELLTGGELFDRIVSRGSYSEKEAASIVKQVAHACQYMHSQGVVHRDLKPENLIYATPDKDAILKVTDFGLAKYLKFPDDVMKTACGTPGYVAPEILKQKPYGGAVDMWSVGVILYILLCGFPPFHAENMRDLYRKIKRGDYSFPSPYWDTVSKAAKDCVRKLLTVKPESRLTADTLLSHPWIKSDEEQSGKVLNTIKNLKKFNHARRMKHGVDMIIGLLHLIKAAGLDADQALKIGKKKAGLIK